MISYRTNQRYFGNLRQVVVECIDQDGLERHHVEPNVMMMMMMMRMMMMIMKMMMMMMTEKENIANLSVSTKR
jgi:hypothetical protein